jgi:hypothetical protein
MPYALGGTALLVIGQLATMKLDFQHFAECCPLIGRDQPEEICDDIGAQG